MSPDSHIADTLGFIVISGIANTSTLPSTADAVAQPSELTNEYVHVCDPAPAVFGVNVAVVSVDFVTSPVHVPVPDSPPGVTVAVIVWAVASSAHFAAASLSVASGTGLTCIVTSASPVQPASSVTNTLSTYESPAGAVPLNVGDWMSVALRYVAPVPVHAAVLYVSDSVIAIGVPAHTTPSFAVVPLVSVVVIAGYSLSRTVTLTVALSVLSQPSTVWLT